MPRGNQISASQLRARREELGLTQAGLGVALGVSANTVARWERGEVAIGNAALVGIALQQLRRSARGRIRPDPAPPARTAVHHNLPSQPSSFVGRTTEIADVKQSLVDAPLVTLVGAGGVGKTRLA